MRPIARSATWWECGTPCSCPRTNDATSGTPNGLARVGGGSCSWRRTARACGTNAAGTRESRLPPRTSTGREGAGPQEGRARRRWVERAEGAVAHMSASATRERSGTSRGMSGRRTSTRAATTSIRTTAASPATRGECRRRRLDASAAEAVARAAEADCTLRRTRVGHRKGSRPGPPRPGGADTSLVGVARLVQSRDALQRVHEGGATYEGRVDRRRSVVQGTNGVEERAGKGRAGRALAQGG